MTKEEREKAIDALKISAPIMAVTQNEFDDYIHTINKIMDWLEQEPYEDAISRQAVDVLVDELARAISDERCCMSRGRSTATIMQDILDLPPVKPQERTGHWIERKNIPKSVDIATANLRWKYECSECEYEVRSKYHFCPNCGADMRGEQNG